MTSLFLEPKEELFGERDREREREREKRKREGKSSSERFGEEKGELEEERFVRGKGRKGKKGDRVGGLDIKASRRRKEIENK